MPELIEVEQYRAAAAVLVGERVRELVLLDPRYPRELPIEAVDAALVGAVIEGVRRHGKLLLLDTDVGLVGIRFGMTGRLLVDGVGPIDRLEYGAATDERKWDRLVVAFVSGRMLTINDPRRLGAVEIDPDLRRLGPDAATITDGELRRALAGGRGALKARLLDQRRVAGLGNLLVDETLWRVGTSPFAVAGALDDAVVGRLASGIRSTILELTERGGSHLGDLQSERSAGGRCPRDGTLLAVGEVGGRTTRWCPEHQRAG